MVEEEKRSSVWGGGRDFIAFLFFSSILDCSTIHRTVVGNFFYINAQLATDLNNNVVNHQTA